jgi:hypothetical protein
LTHPLTEEHRGQAEDTPEEGKGQANLSIEVEGEHMVIPHVPSHPEVDENAYQKLNSGDQESPTKAATQQSTLWCCCNQEIQCHRYDSTGQGHRPVGKPTKSDFQQAIHKAAQEKHPTQFMGLYRQKATLLFIINFPVN